MNDEEGVAVAISPVQMVAILHRKTVSEGETWSNRLWGGLGAQMIARLTAPKAPARASIFLNTRHAELLISEVLSAKRYQIESALKYM